MRSVCRTPKTEIQVNARYTQPAIPQCFFDERSWVECPWGKGRHRPSKRTNFTPDWHPVSRYTSKYLGEERRLDVTLLVRRMAYSRLAAGLVAHCDRLKSVLMATLTTKSFSFSSRHHRTLSCVSTLCAAIRKSHDHVILLEWKRTNPAIDAESFAQPD